MKRILHLNALSRSTAHIVLIACITDTVTCNAGIMTDQQRVEKIIAALKEYDAVFPCEPITMMLESYDKRQER